MLTRTTIYKVIDGKYMSSKIIVLMINIFFLYFSTNFYDEYLCNIFFIRKQCIINGVLFVSLHVSKKNIVFLQKLKHSLK
jgi:hypothetical protein